MDYRQATIDDVPQLASLNCDLIRDEGHRNPMSLGELEARMAAWLSAEYRAVLFGDQRGTAGYALFRDDGEHLYLRQFFVLPERRRQGIGRAAIDMLCAQVWGRGRRVRLDVLVGNSAAIEFWRRVGFSDYCLTMERPPEASAIDRSAGTREQV